MSKIELLKANSYTKEGEGDHAVHTKGATLISHFRQCKPRATNEPSVRQAARGSA